MEWLLYDLDKSDCILNALLLSTSASGTKCPFTSAQNEPDSVSHHIPHWVPSFQTVIGTSKERDHLKEIFNRNCHLASQSFASVQNGLRSKWWYHWWNWRVSCKSRSCYRRGNEWRLYKASVWTAKRKIKEVGYLFCSENTNNNLLAAFMGSRSSKSEQYNTFLSRQILILSQRRIFFPKVSGKSPLHAKVRNTNGNISNKTDLQGKLECVELNLIWNEF